MGWLDDLDKNKTQLKQKTIQSLAILNRVSQRFVDFCDRVNQATPRYSIQYRTNLHVLDQASNRHLRVFENFAYSINNDVYTLTISVSIYPESALNISYHCSPQTFMFRYCHAPLTQRYIKVSEQKLMNLTDEEIEEVIRVLCEEKNVNIAHKIMDELFSVDQ